MLTELNPGKSNSEQTKGSFFSFKQLFTKRNMKGTFIKKQLKFPNDVPSTMLVVQ